MPRKSLILFVVVILVTACCLRQAFSEDQNYKDMRRMAQIVRVLQESYVEPVSSRQLFEGAYRGMLQTLDPYTVYFNQSEATTFQGETEGEFGGIGIELSVQDGVLMVVAPIRGTPAFDAGIVSGDIILKIDGQTTERMRIEDAIKIMRGKVGEKVTITIRHPGAIIDKEMTLVRAVIKPKAIEYEMLSPEIGLMRVSSYTAKVMDEMQAASEDMLKQGMKGMILDLRGNPGGLLDAGVAMVDEFVADGTIVSIKGRGGVKIKEYTAHKGQSLEKIPLVVLIDGGSASASEIVAGALADLHRAPLVGSRSYGKGSVQNVVSLGDGEALKLTTARYYTPSGSPILDRKGIEPDIVVPMSTEILIALRNQEREDKLRGHYRPGAALEGQAPEETPRPEAEPAEGEEENGERRTRVVDLQLKAGYNLLKWELKAVGVLDIAPTTAGK